MKQELLNTYYPAHLNYQSYLEWCELNECEPAAEYSEAYYKWHSNEIQNEVDDFYANLRHSDYQHPCIVTGSVGRWNGTFEIEQTRCDNLSDAIDKCWSGCDDIIVTKRHSVIDVKALHHDGQCNYEVRLLSAVGEDRWDKYGRVNMNDRKNFLTLPEYLW